MSSLHDAAKRGDIAAVRELLKKGADANEEMKMGETPLMLAANADVARELIDAGRAGVRKRNKFGLTALHYTTDAGVASLLVEKGAEIDAEDAAGATPLTMASMEGVLGVVKALVEAKANINHLSGPLHMAVACRQNDVVSYLISKGAELNRQNRDGLTPLHFAARDNRPEAATLLVEKGAALDLKTKEGLTPLQLAQSRNQEAMVTLLRQYEQGKACSAPKTEGAGPKTASPAPWALDACLMDDEEQTPAQRNAGLLEAAEIGDVARTTALLSAGADKKIRNLTGGTALHIAATKGHAGVVKVLLESGAEIEAGDNVGATPLHYAAMGGHAAIVEILLNAGADRTARDKLLRMTPAQMAALKGRVDVVSLLSRG